MFTRYAILIASAVVLVGCATGPTREEVIASDGAECEAYGAQPGTQAYYQCMMAKDQQHNANKTALAAAILARPQPQPYYLPPPPPLR